MHIATTTPIIVLPTLPYAAVALEPVISSKTLSFHYGKHHAGYVNTLNTLIEGTPLAGLPLDEIVRRSAQDPKAAAIFHNAAQVWNHNFYWRSMQASGGGEPAGDLAHAIDDAFGNFEAFRDAFTKAAVGEFGSGWIWLVANPTGELEITVTSNADTPVTAGKKPLITLDVWEHAYYLDYQNRRPDYIAAWFGKLVNWHFAEENFG
jgi:Fe-Mn family superoxide dismutase